jgi:hypothetical protein
MPYFIVFENALSFELIRLSAIWQRQTNYKKLKNVINRPHDGSTEGLEHRTKYIGDYK